MQTGNEWSDSNILQKSSQGRKKPPQLSCAQNSSLMK